MHVGKIPPGEMKKGASKYDSRVRKGVGAEDGIRTHDPLLGKEMLYR